MRPEPARQALTSRSCAPAAPCMRRQKLRDAPGNSRASQKIFDPDTAVTCLATASHASADTRSHGCGAGGRAARRLEPSNGMFARAWREENLKGFNTATLCGQEPPCALRHPLRTKWVDLLRSPLAHNHFYVVLLATQRDVATTPEWFDQSSAGRPGGVACPRTARAVRSPSGTAPPPSPLLIRALSYGVPP